MSSETENIPWDSTVFARRVAEIQDRMGLSQSDFAKLCGMNRSTYFRVIKYDREPRAGTIKAICHATGVSADYILGLTDIKPKIRKKKK